MVSPMNKFLALCICILMKLTVNGFQQTKEDIQEMAVEIFEPAGIVTSENYPNGYNSQSSQSWRFRVPDAQFYTLKITDMDLDTGGCYDYLVIYDDSDYTKPGLNLCNKPSSSIVINSHKITVSFVTGSSFSAGKRGAGFSLTYSTNGDGQPESTLTPVVSSTTNSFTTTTLAESENTTGQPSKTTIDTNATETPTTNSPYTEADTTIGESFPPGAQDDSQCGNPAIKPQITGFDYETEGESISLFNPSSKVVNGEETVPHSWPWQVSLQGSYGAAYCGGTLIRDQWIVTAAHCADLIFIGTYGSDQVALGMHDKQVNEASQQLIDIIAVYVHPQYDNPDRSHDVALVKIAHPAELNEYVSLACEAHAGWKFPAGMTCVVTGWGVTVEGGNVGTFRLQQAPLPLLSDKACYDLYQQANLDTTDDMQCAGGMGKGACNGDSGGPLNCFVNNRWYHMGIVSFGEANCDTEIASVYAGVAELRSFIDGVIEQFS